MGPSALVPDEFMNHDHHPEGGPNWVAIILCKAVTFQ